MLMMLMFVLLLVLEPQKMFHLVTVEMLSFDHTQIIHDSTQE